MKEGKMENIVSSFRRFVQRAEKSKNLKFLEKVLYSINNQCIKTNDIQEDKTEDNNNINEDCYPDYEEVILPNLYESTPLVKDALEEEISLPNIKGKKLQFSEENSVDYLDEPEYPEEKPIICKNLETQKPSEIGSCNSEKLAIEKAINKETTVLIKEVENNLNKEILTSEVLEEVNYFRRVEEKPKLDIQIDSSVSSDRIVDEKPVKEKFVVNLFESRSSGRWLRQSIRGKFQNRLDAGIVKVDAKKKSEELTKTESKPQEIIHSSDDNLPECPRVDYIQSDKDGLFQKLKKDRDIECVKMHQASNALQAIRDGKKEDWSEELIAEKILLQTAEKYKLIVDKMRDLNYSEIKSRKINHLGSISISGFHFPLKPSTTPKKTEEFYILMVSFGTEVRLSKIVCPEDDYINFEDVFTFTNIESNFNIRLQVYSIQLQHSGKVTRSLFRKKDKKVRRMSKIFYENVHTLEMEESKVLKTNFKLDGEIYIRKDCMDNSSWIVTKNNDSRLQNVAQFSVNVDDIAIKTNLKGFLTLGTENNDITIFWERKWCVLRGTQLKMYNYPSEEDFSEPVHSINLKYCISSVISTTCTKKRTFVLKTARPSAIDDKNTSTLRLRPNFVVDKYFFSADNAPDSKLWTEELRSILESLKDWKNLLFVDDDYLR